jgi:hypothetical protein
VTPWPSGSGPDGSLGSDAHAAGDGFGAGDAFGVGDAPVPDGAGDGAAQASDGSASDGSLADATVADATVAPCDGGATNACGGCTTLSNAVGGACGCGGHYVCSGSDAVTCANDAGMNACGACGALGHTLNGACGCCGHWVCSAGNDNVCSDSCANTPCRNAADGVYCGYSTVDGFAGTVGTDGLYYCHGGCETQVLSCASTSCQINPSGADECCLPSAGNCGNGVCGPTCGSICCDRGLTCISNSPPDCE